MDDPPSAVLRCPYRKSTPKAGLLAWDSSEASFNLRDAAVLCRYIGNILTRYIGMNASEKID